MKALLRGPADVWTGRRRWCLAAGLLTIAVAGITTAAHQGVRSLPGVVRTNTGTLSGTLPTSGEPASARRGQARSAPTAMRIPAIGLSVRVGELGTNADGTVEVPTDFAKAGWFRLGPSPGQLGSAVILGHVDSYQGPAAFFRLRELHAGDEVDVQLANGSTARFLVRSVETYAKDRFPSRLVYAPHGDQALQLVTCGGVFDPSVRSYRSNVVVFTTLAGTHQNAGRAPALAQ